MKYNLRRRGFDLGEVSLSDYISDDLDDWHAGAPVLLRYACSDKLRQAGAQIEASNTLYQAILDDQECDSLLAKAPYAKQLAPLFCSLGCTVNEGDDQEIETIIFDAINENCSDSDDILAEDLWLKISWLSFHEEDASIRFRFSFGTDFVEDVAADKNRQHYAGLLADAVFPESAIITENSTLKTQLCRLLETDNIHFVERIVYFNAANGGAYLHHDRERGHAGVVYAQLTGNTFWLALPRHQLVDEIRGFIGDCIECQSWPENLTQLDQDEISELCKESDTLTQELESFSNSSLIKLINESTRFVHRLILKGFARYLEPGDVLLLPQETDHDCCWHSVFSVSDEDDNDSIEHRAGQALSFAIRRD